MGEVIDQPPGSLLKQYEYNRKNNSGKFTGFLNKGQGALTRG